MNKSPVIVLTLMFFFVIPVKFLQGQEKKAEVSENKRVLQNVKKDVTEKKPDALPEKKDPKNIKKTEIVKTAEKKPESNIPKKTEPLKKIRKDAAFNKKKSAGRTEGLENILLYIKDGSYKYKRIPGYKTKEKPAEIATEQNNEKKIIKIPDRIEVDEIEKEGLFGMSKEKTDLLVKGGFIFLISLIFILYKIRSRRSSHKVLRRFPNK